MSGNIDMAKNRLLELPEPTDDQEPATKGYVDALTKFIWKDASLSAMSDLARTEYLDWTALDLAYETSPNAKLAILRLRIKANVVGTGDYSFICVRKHGTTPGYYPLVRLDKAGATINVYNHESLIVGMDTDQLIDYRIWVGTGWELESRIEVLGYIE